MTAAHAGAGPGRPVILLVEDNASTRRRLFEALEGDGYEVLEAADAANALRLVRERAPDLVVQGLPFRDADGLRLVGQLRSLGTGSFAALAFSETSTGLEAARAPGSGFDAVVGPLTSTDDVRKAVAVHFAGPSRRSAGTLGSSVAVLGAEFEIRRDAPASPDEVSPAELLAAAPDLLLHVDPQGRVCRVNRPSSSLAPQGLLGGSLLALAAPEHHDGMRAALAAVLSGRDDATVETSRVGADGVTWMSCHFAPVRHHDLVVGAAVGVRDISIYKRTEAQLIVSDRMASIGMLTAGVAHEINNPLSSVLANLDLALREVARVAAELPISSELEDGLRDAREAAVRVKTIVRDIRSFARAEDDRVGPVDVRRAIEAVLRLAQNEIRHRARVSTSFAALPPVLANESRLGQVFLNLLINAAQAIPEGKADDNEIRVVTSMSASGGVVIEVADTGCGMAPDVLKRLFTPFFTTKPAGVGTGLGLSICQRIVSGMGGRIDVSSEAGRGSSVRVCLPAGSAERAAPSVTAPPPVSVASRRGRVLVIDDERLVGSAIRRTLASEHDVTTVESARAALDRFAGGEQFDVIFCDLMMPEMTGMDLHRELREAYPEQAARVIFLTGGAFTPRARAFLERVPNPRVDKPFDLEQVRALVNERLR